MLNSLASSGGTHRRRLIVVAGTILLLVAAVTSYSLLALRHQTASPSAVEATKPAPVDTVFRVPSSSPTTLMPLAKSADPETFADSVAQGLFGWDTTSTITTTRLTERLMAVADPTGESSAGLVADITNYLPSSDAWAVLRLYDTRQWIEITSVAVPSLWSTAVEQAGPGGLLPGTTAYTIRGVRHRSGVWEGDSVHTAHEVAFTVFLVCAPSYPECHLLRLSRLDEPLD